MANENGDVFEKTYTYGVILRGKLEEIQKLMDFLKVSDLVIAHDELGQEKLWIQPEREK